LRIEMHARSARMRFRGWAFPCGAVALTALRLAAPAAAQNVSNVSGADVKAGAQEFEYRAAFAPDHDGNPSAFAHRVSYKQAFDDRWSAKIEALQSGGDLEFRSVSIEVQKQFLESEETGGWDSAIRIDGRIPTEDGRGRARAAWLNGVNFDGGWQVRGNVYLGHEIGDQARDGFTLETREEVTRRLGNGMRFGAQMFNNFNTTARFGPFDEHKHQLGPVVKGGISRHVRFNAGVLFGLSGRAPDADFRFFLLYAF